MRKDSYWYPTRNVSWTNWRQKNERANFFGKAPNSDNTFGTWYQEKRQINCGWTFSSNWSFNWSWIWKNSFYLRSNEKWAKCPNTSRRLEAKIKRHMAYNLCGEVLYSRKSLLKVEDCLKSLQTEFELPVTAFYEYVATSRRERHGGLTYCTPTMLSFSCAWKTHTARR